MNQDPPLDRPGTLIPEPILPRSGPHASRSLLIAGGILLLLILAGVFLYPHLVRSPHPNQALEDMFNANRIDDALSAVEAKLETNQNNAPLLAMKALILAQKGSVEYQEAKFGAQAEVVAKQAIALDPKSSEAHRVLGYAYEIQRQYSNAHTEYASALALNPGNVDAVFDDAHVLYLEGDIEKARKGYLAALALEPAYAPAHAGIGGLLAASGDVEGAIAEYEKSYAATQNRHNKAESAYSLGILSIQAGNLPVAEKYLKEATTLEPRYPLGWYGLGKLQITRASVTGAGAPTDAQRLALLKASLSSYSAALKFNPHLAVAYLAVAHIDSAIIKKDDVALKVIAAGLKAIPLDTTMSDSAKKELQKQFEILKAEIQNKK